MLAALSQQTAAKHGTRTKWRPGGGQDEGECEGDCEGDSPPARGTRPCVLGLFASKPSKPIESRVLRPVLRKAPSLASRPTGAHPSPRPRTPTPTPSPSPAAHETGAIGFGFGPQAHESHAERHRESGHPPRAAHSSTARRALSTAMKRKFSFNLAPAKAPPKPDAKTVPKPVPEPALSHAHSHRRHHSKDSMLPLNSPFISRRPLDPKTEQELRAACALILQNFKPSDHGMDADPKLDFGAFNRRKEQQRSGPTTSKVQRPAASSADQRSAQEARKQNRRTDTAVMSYPDLPMQANTGRRRADQGMAADKEKDARKNPKSSSSDKPRSSAARAELDSDDGKSVGTPLTGSSDPQHHNGSTAPTSAALTSGGNSKRASRQFESAAALADAQATEWMRQELEKRRQQLGSQPAPPPEPQVPVRPLSRAKSIRSEIKEYIFPGSTSLSRTQSHESMTSSSSQQPRRSGSQHGWRSWGLQRITSSRNNSRPGTSKGRIESQDQDKKGELNLNRELPPLPSLDSWKHLEQSKDSHKSHAQGTHIATLMRPQDQQQRDYAAAVRQHHRRSGSDTLAMRYANAYPQASRSATHKDVQSQLAQPFDSAMDFDQMMSAMSSARDFDEQLGYRTNPYGHHRRSSSLSRSVSVKVSSEIRLDAPPNFSRKISTEVANELRPHDAEYAYPNVVQLASPPNEHKSKLKKVFSGWMLRKDKKEDWMHRLEKEGIKGGVMIQDDGAALPPVVRY
ncbi:hypothetical protein BS50DRAFT_627282 [Corynespora cassiicola Philippines]|uniref:Uncharacterized protein n=1 Tax=Corynespora cassiicola Philippines TaxID=1448308 RepID=A0A2T2P8C2_CORCC|nr:hypothetical protein BS50DRAFT_627282 [Corynespora cassiicola Philippines]